MNNLFAKAFITKKLSAISILPLNKIGLKAWLKSAPSPAANWVKANHFKADVGAFLLVPSFDNEKPIVLWAIENDTLPQDPWSYAKLAESLPEGVYQLPKKIAKDTAFNAAFGWGLSHYGFDQFLSKKNKTKAQLILPSTGDDATLKASLEAVCLVRDLVNTPTNYMTPAILANEAKILAKQHKAKIAITEGDKLLKGFPTIHAVGRASDNKPCLIDMTWGNARHPQLTLVGKGVCFDSGGLDIKPSSGMRHMKKDMGGAAHVLGLAHMIMALNIPVRLRVLIPAVENSISANAFRPGDIIKTRKGLTVEVGNTDAEGRLVLCDALNLADDEKPEMLIDFATLTGAARVALGPDLPALFTHNKSLAKKLLEAGEKNHDPLWQLPLWQGYANDLKSNIADMNNMADHGFAGASIGALFLDRFVEHTKQWVHFDIFAWNPTNRPGKPQGGEAMGIRACFNVIRAHFTSIK